MGSVRGRDSPIRLGRSSYNTATLKPLRVYVHMPQDQASFVRDGDPAAVGSNSIRSVASAETVTRHPFGAGVGDPHHAVEVVIPNDDEHCFPGMYARVAIAVSGAPSVPLVPDNGLNGDEIVATNLGQTPQEGERVHTVAVPQR